MPEENASSVFSELEEKIEGQISYVIHYFQNLTDEQLTEKLDSNSWSIAQCLQHLNTYGDFYLPLLKQEIETGKAASPNTVHKSSWLGNFFVSMMDVDKSSRKFKAKKIHLRYKRYLLYL